MNKAAYVYIMTNRNNTVLYTGVTSNLVKRVYQHKAGRIEGFTKKYKATKLVYYEIGSDITHAIEREKQIKKWRRAKKIILVEKCNPEWKDLYTNLI